MIGSTLIALFLAVVIVGGGFYLSSRLTAADARLAALEAARETPSKAAILTAPAEAIIATPKPDPFKPGTWESQAQGFIRKNLEQMTSSANPPPHRHRQ